MASDVYNSVADTGLSRICTYSNMKNTLCIRGAWSDHDSKSGLCSLGDVKPLGERKSEHIGLTTKRSGDAIDAKRSPNRINL